MTEQVKTQEYVADTALSHDFHGNDTFLAADGHVNQQFLSIFLYIEIIAKKQLPNQYQQARCKIIRSPISGLASALKPL